MDNNRLWVFGYGSLMWNPGFEHDRISIARLTGFARSFCMWSIHHRGTVEVPGLVLALDETPGAFCDGLALRTVQGKEEEVLKYLRERELISSAYVERTTEIRLADGSRVSALTFVVDPEHEQYCSGMALADQAKVIARAHGGRGPNPEYLHNTAAHMKELGIDDHDINWLDEQVRQIQLNRGE